jgi:hypothetical protein
MLALAFLTSIALAARNPPPEESHHPPDAVMQTSLCPLSVPEARHLLARLLFPPPSSPPLVQGAGRPGGASTNIWPASAILATVGIGWLKGT